ncbi:MAG TPA: reverse transcriptase-like protein [Candidatus Saccharimonadales bacterium]|nr:reverse transcriptase-like protein [Candidatus Saccharimonadales bacterium]
MKQTLHVRAVIKQDSKVLLLRRASGNPAYIGLFELPGGKVDFGEDPKAALQREVIEETGLEIESLQLYDVHSMLDSYDSHHQYVVLSFLATLKTGKIVLSSEHDKFDWIKLGEIHLSNVTETTSRALALDERGEVPEVSPEVNVEQTTTKTDHLIIYADGGSRGNPGPSASGFVILDSSEKLIFEGGKYLGITTNNQAEYNAVRFALDKARELGGREIEVRLDSLLVVNQLNGVYQIKNRDLWPIHTYIKNISKEFKHISFSHVRREFNKEADAMVNKILDEQA